MDRDYVPFKDYLSLSSVAWNQVKNLRCLIPPQCGSNMYEEEFLLNDNLLPRPSYDSLDEVRANSFDDFKRNGIDKDLDDIDKYQHQIREVRALAPVNHHPDTAHFRQLNKSKRKSKKSCAFCKNNGELPSLYNSHVLKDSNGKVLCPVLRKYTCPTCGENGDSAHTIRYCPQNTTGASAGLLIFLNSSRDSAGRLKVHK